MFELTFGAYSVQVEDGSLPELYVEYLRRARLNVEIDVTANEGRAAFCAVSKYEEWPFLVVSLRYSPVGPGCSPGVLVVPETEVLFLGAGTQLLAFDLGTPSQLWEDVADVCFWRWRRHADIVLMSAELELAAWSLKGRKLWTTFAEPPWSYSIEDGLVKLDVMGKVSAFPLQDGP